MKPTEGRKRVIIEEVQPQIDGGRYPTKRVLGDRILVSAAIFGDGHDHVAGKLLYRHEDDRRWRSTPFAPLGNDLWQAEFRPEKIGMYRFTLQAWIDHFDTWNSDLQKRLSAQPDPANPRSGDAVQDIPLALRTGALLLQQTASRAKGPDLKQLSEISQSLSWMADQSATTYEYAITPDILALAASYPDLELATKYDRELEIWVDRPRARFSSWYELFPRSTGPLVPGPDGTLIQQHGTFANVAALVPEIAANGFDVLYLPPIHPIGTAFRKGPNNSVTAQPGDHGSPWAIGSAAGGHKAIHSELGTLDDFNDLIETLANHNMELAMDIAFQCAPDHPWVKEHPEWFSIRPDGSIQYAENPPKKYQDIYPLNFESSNWRGLWEALLDVFEHWIKHDVKIFRVDNPHTKALPFWEWVIAEIHAQHPDVIFLAEAFTRPHVMYSLAKAGYSQSYSYFTWRNTAAELRTYFEEITKPPVTDFFRPNLWPNTPDILHASLQQGGRPAFMQRVILAATLGASYGIYGPSYELGDNLPARPSPGKTESEEYFNSEKYQLRQWDRTASHSIAPLIAQLNRIRKENPALQFDNSLIFHDVDNPNLLCYSKSAPYPAAVRSSGSTNSPRDVHAPASAEVAGSSTTELASASNQATSADNTILVAINLDPANEQGGWIDLDLKALGIPHNQNFDVEDLLTGQHFQWHDRSNYVALRPDIQPAHIFRITH